jgi:hypothetical protein
MSEARSRWDPPEAIRCGSEDIGLIIDPGKTTGCGGWAERKVIWFFEPVELEDG